MINLPFENDAVVIGILSIILAFIFYTHASKNKYLVAFYKYIPALLLCYFIPAIFNSLGIIDGEKSNLYFVASRQNRSDYEAFPYIPVFGKVLPG